MTKSPRAVAREALRLAREALPAYSSKFSRRDYTQQDRPSRGGALGSAEGLLHQGWKDSDHSRLPPAIVTTAQDEAGWPCVPRLRRASPAALSQSEDGAANVLGQLRPDVSDAGQVRVARNGHGKQDGKRSGVALQVYEGTRLGDRRRKTVDL